MRPKTDGRKIRFGFPWVYQDQLVLDRRTKALPAGSIVELEDSERMVLGCGAFNSDSKITFRMLDKDPKAVIDQAWFTQKIQTALNLRETLFAEPFYRLVHAEADGLPGIIIDRFGDTCVIQPNAAYSDVLFDALVGAVSDVTGVANIYKNASGRARGLEGLDDVSSWAKGGVDAAIPVQMNGATYMADLTGGQKTGLFFDQRSNHAFTAQLTKDADVLDVFSHVGGFGLAALANGAKSATFVDGSAPALALAEQGAKASGFDAAITTLKGDAFSVMENLYNQDKTFDVVVCDPPAFAPSKPALQAGLRAYERAARASAQLVKPGGYVVLCSCSHAAGLDVFRAASLRGIGRAGRTAQIIHSGTAGPDHPTHPYLAESSYLKAIFLRLD
jgi:23S rRNA (cytosine1962-C5)-methyltransferase